MKLSIILAVCLVVSVSGTWPPKAKPNCTLPPDSGKCFSWLRRFYYNTATGRCEEFHYTGCKGNTNRFKTFRECSDTCCHQGNSGGNGGSGGVWIGGNGGSSLNGGNGGSGGVWNGGNGGSSLNGGNGGSGGVWNGGNGGSGLNGGNGGSGGVWNGGNGGNG